MNRSSTFVSIVMPSLNQAAFISLAIESVLSQGYENLELIVADGGSSDGTIDLLRERQQRDKRLIWFSEPDTGPANALNKALSKTRGTIIGWLNGDDLYTPGAIGRAVDVLQSHPNWLMVYGQGQHIDETGSLLGIYPTLPPETPPDRFSDGCFICQPTVFFRRSLFVLTGKLDESLKTAFDFDYWVRVFLTFPGRIGFLDAIQAYSRLHPACLTISLRRAVALEGMRVLSRHLGTAPSHWIVSYVEEVVGGKAMIDAADDLQQHVLDLIDAAAEFMTVHEQERLRNTILKRIHKDQIQIDPKNILRKKPLPCGHHRAQKKLTILLLGNCQIMTLERLLDAMTGGAKTSSIELTDANVALITSGRLNLHQRIAECDFILFQPLPHEKFHQEFIEIYPQAIDKLRLVPRIGFSAFHPDADYITLPNGKQLGGALGPYHSMLALYGWKNSFSIEETLALFQRDIFQQVGYFDYLPPSQKFLSEQGRLSNLPLDDLIKKWLKTGCFMHTMNHPKLHVLADVARAILLREKIEAIPAVEEYLEDLLSFDHCWPVYPEVAEHLGIVGHYWFKKGRGTPHGENYPVAMLDLREFIQGSFDEYDKHLKDDLICPRLDSERYKSLDSHLAQHPTHSANGFCEVKSVPSVKGTNPYKELPDHQFWRKAFLGRRREEIDPVVCSRFKLTPTDKIATAGSCFAQHIARTLQRHQFNYYITEAGDELNEQEKEARNYGIFSARYGNIYTTRQLVQLFERAYGLFDPCDHSWVRSDGKHTDPFRPQIEPNGFDTLEDLEISRSSHLKLVKDLFETLDIFIFTLGLTEAWRSRLDGAVFPLAPGVVSGTNNESIYEFVNFNTNEIVDDLLKFIDLLLGVNPRARFIFTVSPVPLIATYEARHVLVSTMHSKATLLAAIHEVVRRRDMCDYFPSYEIITGSYTYSAYFEDDLRSVKQAGVDHVMRLFMKHYTEATKTTATAATPTMLEEELACEAQRINEVICDEEAIITGP